MITKFKKIFIYSLTIGMIIITLILSGVLLIQQQEKKNEPIKLTNTKDTTLVFYRDDCKDCQKIFLDVYLQKISGQQIILINMNNPTNRQRYICHYDLYSVPTFIKNSQKYVGTNIKKINQLIRK